VRIKELLLHAVAVEVGAAASLGFFGADPGWSGKSWERQAK